MKNKQSHKIIRNFLLLLIIFPMLSASETDADKITTIHIVTPAWEDQTNEDGTGLFFDIIRRVYEPVGIKMAFEIVPWKRAEKMIELNKADARLAVFRLSEDQLMPDYPLYVDYTLAIFRKEHITDWNGIKTLENKKCVWLRGYNFHHVPAFKDVRLKWEEVNNAEQGWKMIDSGRADFYLDSLIDVKRYIKRNHIDMTSYQMNIILRENAYAEFAKTEKSKKLIQIYNKKFKKLYDSGELEKIFKKWNVDFELKIEK